VLADVLAQDKRWWDYSALFGSRAARYRIACNCVFSIFAQWAGNGVLSYFLPAVLETAGYKSGVQQANINLGYACFQFVFALTGAAFVDRIGRRPLMLFSMTGCCIVWMAMTAATGVFNETGKTNDSAAKATVACIFLFGAVFSIGITPLQALYPGEQSIIEDEAKKGANDRQSRFSRSRAGPKGWHSRRWPSTRAGC
jgi:MFS family permease